MKKGIKKLQLARETLQPLQVEKAAGGLDTHFDHTCGTVCDIDTWHCTDWVVCGRGGEI